MKENLRVHIVPIGYDYYTRITEPLISKSADKVYFIRHNEGNRGHEKFYERVKREIGKRAKRVIIKDEILDIWDLDSCIERIRQITLKEKEKGNHVHINVSTGTKVTAMAGMFAAMAWKITPYYVRLKNPLLKKIEVIPNVAVNEPTEIQVYDMEKPKPVYMMILDNLSKNKGKMRKQDLIEYLQMEDMIKPVDGSEKTFSENAKLSQLRVLLDPMEKKWGFVTVEHSGRKSVVSITENGVKALRVFGIETHRSLKAIHHRISP